MSKPETTKKQLRSFGFVVGGVFTLLGVWPAVFRSGNPRLWCLIVAALLLLPAICLPSVLLQPYRAWMFVGSILGWINTRIILGFIFCVVFTPIGFLMRRFGRNSLCLNLDRSVESYRVLKEPRPDSHMRQQF